MNKFRAFRLLLAIAASLGFSCESSFSQTDGYLSSNNLHGIVSGNSYQFGSIDNINLGTGAINIRIPLLSVKGRGITDEYVYFYSSKIWVATPDWNIDNPNLLDDLVWVESVQPNAIIGKNPGGQVLYTEQNYQCEWNNQPLGQNVDTNFTYVTNDGATYKFGNRHIWNSDGSSPNSKSCPGVNISQYNVMQSNEGVLQLDTTNSPNAVYPTTAPIVTMKNGSRILANPLCSITCLPISVEDTNGNLENGSGDTLLRTMSFPIKDSNGNTQSYVAHSSYVGATSAFPSTSCGAAPVIQPGGSFYQATSLTLPNNWSYTFTYDPQFGDITKLTLPSGGYIRYDYMILPQVDGGPVNHYCYLDSRRIAHRYVSPDGNPQHEQTWTYTYTTVNSITTTVTDPLGNVTVHTFMMSGNPNAGGRIPHETTTQYQQNGTAIKTISNTWAFDSCAVQSLQSNGKGWVLMNDAVNARIVDTTTTLNDTNQVSDHQTDYDSYQPQAFTCSFSSSPTESRMNPTEVREYDYGNGVAGPLIRKTDFTYLHNNNSNYLNAHIWDRTASKSIYDGSSSLKAQTTYEYDNYTLGLTASSAVQHDSVYNTSYTLRGNLTATNRWRNTDGAWLTTRNQFDDAGNVRSTTDPKGYTTSFSYTDSWGNTACVPTGGNAAAFSTTTTDPLTHTFKATYNSCSGTIASATGVNNRTTTITYDGMGRPTLVKAPDNGQTSFSYTDTAPLSASSTSTVTSALNLVNTILLDGLGRISQTQLNSDPGGVTYVDTTYDAVGRQSTVSNPHRTASLPTDGITTSIYDALGRTCVVVPPDGTAVSTCPATAPANDVFSTYSGNCTAVKDQAGKSRKSCSDGLGRLTQVFEDPAGLNYETDYTYDTLNNLLTVNQKGGSSNSASWRTRTFTYNSLSQLLTAVNPESGTITYTYDSNGNLSTKTFPQQNQTNPAVTLTGYFCYDNENRLVSKAYSATALTCPLSSPFASYSYDGTNCLGLSSCFNTHHRTGMIDTAGSEVWAYGDVTNQGPVVVDQRTTNSITKTATYQSNLDGSLVSLTYPSGRVINYTLASSGTNTAGRMASAVDSTGPINYATVALYSPAGALSSFTNSASIVSTYLYNNRLQPCRISVKNTGSAPATCTDTATGNVLDFAYCFNSNMSDADRAAHNCAASATLNNGNVAQIVNKQTTARTQNFKYDSLNRIQSAYTESTTGQYCWDEAFGYDPWANLLTIGRISGYTCSNEELLNVGATNNNQISGDTYDAPGNLINDGLGHTYAYNAENQMTLTAGVTYTYDGDGKRVQKSSGKLYWYGMGSDPLDETDLTGSITTPTFKEYAFFNGKRIARRDSTNAVNYYFSDHLGTARIVANSSGSVLDDSDFYPFGGERVITSSSGNIYRFTGKERDSESGLDNFGARHNSPNLGRFMSVDPSRIINKSNPQSWNRYNYALNNPLRFVDADGKWPQDIHERIIDSAFPGLSTQQRDQLKRTSSWVDRIPGGQTKEHNHEHAMRSPGENPATANRAIDQNIQNHEQAAQRAQGGAPERADQINNGALNEFGQALHTATDRTSPAHTDANGNPREWSGLPTSPSEVTAVNQHVAEEATATPEQFEIAVIAAQQAFKTTFGDAAFQEATTVPNPVPPPTTSSPPPAPKPDGQ
jgi:RHS repeat-associated protein